VQGDNEEVLLPSFPRYRTYERKRRTIWIQSNAGGPDSTNPSPPPSPIREIEEHRTTILTIMHNSTDVLWIQGFKLRPAVKDQGNPRCSLWMSPRTSGSYAWAFILPHDALDCSILAWALESGVGKDSCQLSSPLVAGRDTGLRYSKPTFVDFSKEASPQSTR
jgi:hypothetical protein